MRQAPRVGGGDSGVSKKHVWPPHLRKRPARATAAVIRRRHYDARGATQWFRVSFFRRLVYKLCTRLSGGTRSSAGRVPIFYVILSETRKKRKKKFVHSAAPGARRTRPRRSCDHVSTFVTRLLPDGHGEGGGETSRIVHTGIFLDSERSKKYADVRVC